MYCVKNLMADLVPAAVDCGPSVSMPLYSWLSLICARAQPTISRIDDVEASAAVSPKTCSEHCVFQS